MTDPEINKSFEELFAAMRSGQPLDTPPETRRLAELAAVRVQESVDVEHWAEVLANDVAPRGASE